MEHITAPAQMLDLIRITYADGAHCVCEAKDVPDMTEGCEAGWKSEPVRMSLAAWRALPDFEG